MSYDFDLESFARTVPLPEDSSDTTLTPRLLLEETELLFSSLSLSSTQHDLLKFDKTPLLTPAIIQNNPNLVLPGPVTDTEMKNVDDTYVEDLDESI